MPNDDLVAKCSPRGWDAGDVIWTSYLPNKIAGVANDAYAHRGHKTPMAYKMEHWASRKNGYRTIDEIIVTNLTCGVGKGWDVVLYDDVVQHCQYKNEAQAEAEKLLDGKA